MATSNKVDDFPKRLRQFIDYLRMSANRFGVNTRAGEKNIANALEGADTKRSTIAAIVVKYPELNLNWLFLGTGEMLLKVGNEKNSIAESDNDKYKSELKSSNLELQYLRNEVATLKSTIQDKEEIIKLLKKGK